MVSNAGAIEVRLAAAPDTMPIVFHCTTVADMIPNSTGPGHDPGWTPGSEEHQRYGDESLSGRDVLLEHTNLKGERRASQSGQRASR